MVTGSTFRASVFHITFIRRVFMLFLLKVRMKTQRWHMYILFFFFFCLRKYTDNAWLYLVLRPFLLGCVHLSPIFQKGFQINEFHWNDKGTIKLMENMHRKKMKGLSPFFYTLIIEIQRNLIAGSISVQKKKL